MLGNMPVVGPQYPVNLSLAGRPCLVVGGGRVATRKVEGLLAANASVHVIATEVSVELRTLDVTYDERPFWPGDVEGFRLVITATNKPHVNRIVFEDAERHGIWVNAADDPASCSFTLPAVTRRGPLMMTVSTGGHSPALATHIKGKLEKQFGPEWEQLLHELSERREQMKAQGMSTENFDWRPLLEQVR
jgi:precorrin-2 dehydrogenase / sirohydrochlorin ferrochelatase